MQPSDEVSASTNSAVTVFCGSRSGADPRYTEAARAFARELHARGLSLVYGAGNCGLMGVLADTALELGVKVVGVIPDFLVGIEVAHGGLDELHVVADMHERKALMARHAGAFVALPGGLGTFEELFEVWTWAQLGLHRKPIGLLDVGGFWQGLLSQLDRMVDQGFVDAGERARIRVADDPSLLLDALGLPSASA